MSDTSFLRRHGHLVAVVVSILALFFYVYRMDRWLMDDDEGGFCYAAWRISEGEAPYRDFLTEQVPLFLYWGGAVVRLFGPSVMPLRYATVLTTLLAALVIYITAAEVFGYRVGVLCLPLFLLHKDVYLIARFFRPEAYMLLFSALGAYVCVRACRDGRRGKMFGSGVLFGLAMLNKLFAVLPAAGCGLWVLNRWYVSKERRWLVQLLSFAGGFALTAATVFAAFQWKYPVFLDALFRLHLLQGAELSLPQVVAKGLGFLWNYFKANPIFMLLALFGAARAAGAADDRGRLFAWQVPTAAVFLVLSRSLQDRHLVYWVPALCVMAALSLERLLAGDVWPHAAFRPGKEARHGSQWLWATACLAVTVLTLWPSLRADQDVASWEDSDTPRLAEYIQANTDPDDVVLCEYNELNFRASRKNTYLAADLSNVTASTGQITGAGLIQELEGEDVQMVWINTVGGASHLVYLRDYDDFYRYVQGHFHLVGLFQRVYESFEVYSRRDLLPLLPGVEFGGLALTGADLGNQAVASGGVLPVTLRWQVLQPMARDYSVSVRLLDANGNRCCQQDGPLLWLYTSLLPDEGQEVEYAPTSQWPRGQQVLERHGLPVAPSTPTGTYSVALVVYELASGEVLPATDAAGQAAGTEFLLTTVQVTNPASR